MASKNREYHVATNPANKFFSFLVPSAPHRVREKVEPSPPYSVPKSPRHERAMLAIAEESNKTTFSTPAAAKPKPITSRGRTAKSKKAEPPREPDSWSEWYESGDNQFLWRARQLPDESWDYEFQPAQPESAPQSRSRPSSPETTATEDESAVVGELSDGNGNPQGALLHPRSAGAISAAGSPPASPTGGSGRLLTPGSPAGSLPRNHAAAALSSPKSSWPTIITTSTGQPTDLNIYHASPRTSGVLPRYESSSPPMSPAIAPRVAAPHNGGKMLSPSTAKRTIHGPVMWLLQEGRSRKAKSVATTTAAAAPSAAHPPPAYPQAPPPATIAPLQIPSQHLSQYQHQYQQYQQGHPLTPGGVPLIVVDSGSPTASQAAAAPQQNSYYYHPSTAAAAAAGTVMTMPMMTITKTRPALSSPPLAAPPTAAYAKKLDRKVKSEKEMKYDSKKRVKNWLREVDADEESLIPLDGAGLPVYR